MGIWKEKFSNWKFQDNFTNFAFKISIFRVNLNQTLAMNRIRNFKRARCNWLIFSFSVVFCYFFFKRYLKLLFFMDFRYKKKSFNKLNRNSLSIQNKKIVFFSRGNIRLAYLVFQKNVEDLQQKQSLNFIKISMEII